MALAVGCGQVTRNQKTIYSGPPSFWVNIFIRAMRIGCALINRLRLAVALGYLCASQMLIGHRPRRPLYVLSFYAQNPGQSGVLTLFRSPSRESLFRPRVC